MGKGSIVKEGKPLSITKASAKFVCFVVCIRNIIENYKKKRDRNILTRKMFVLSIQQLCLLYCHTAFINQFMTRCIVPNTSKKTHIHIHHIFSFSLESNTGNLQG